MEPCPCRDILSFLRLHHNPIFGEPQGTHTQPLYLFIYLFIWMFIYFFLFSNHSMGVTGHFPRGELLACAARGVWMPNRCEGWSARTGQMSPWQRRCGMARLEHERQWQLNPTTHGRTGTTASWQPNDSCGQPGPASPNVWLSGSGTGSANVYWAILISSVFI